MDVLNYEKSGLAKADCIKGHSNPVLSPFFWLRDDTDSDEAIGTTGSQQTNGSDLPEPVIPSFSDIKNLDDNIHTNLSSMRKSCGNRIFDSEVFEWTLRECSPELFSTPMKKVPDKGRQEVILEDEFAEKSFMPSPNKGCDNKKGKAKGLKTKLKRDPPRNIRREIDKKASKPNNMPRGSSFLHKSTGLTENLGKKGVVIEGNRGFSAAKDRNKVGKGSISKVRRQPMKNLKNLFEDDMVSEQHDPVAYPLGADLKPNENNCNGKLVDGALTTIPESIYPGSSKGVLNLDIENGKTEKGSPGSSCQQVENREKLEPINGRIKKYKGTSWLHKNRVMGAKNLKRKIKQTDQQAKDVEMPKSGKGRMQNKKVNAGTKRQVNDTEEQKGLSSHTCWVNSTNEHRAHPEQMCAIMRPEASPLSESPTCAIMRLEASPFSESQQTHQNMTSNSPYPVKCLHVGKGHLKKCNATQFKCAFCHSSEDTEVSGQMMHYFNGKPVDAKHNGGIHVIHAHRYRTEWAPNVYFEDQTAVNLINEVARSRGIKCSKCNIKGAALGCYDKNCRRSFPFTCAKSLGCWWDNST